MTRFALLLSLLAVGALGLVACDDDGETARTETEVITSTFGAGGPVAAAGGPVAVAGGPDACGDYHGKGPGGYPVRIDVLDGVVRCRVAQRVLKNYYHDRKTPRWSCVDHGDALVECVKPEVVFAGHFYCREMTRGGQALCLSRFGPP
jgi:hypothetical protein